jgi:hypothetical protein
MVVRNTSKQWSFIYVMHDVPWIENMRAARVLPITKVHLHLLFYYTSTYFILLLLLLSTLLNGPTQSLACTIVQCRVLRTISSVDGKHLTLAPCPTKTAPPIQTKFGRIDYAVEVNTSAKFGSNRVMGDAPTWG